MFTKTFTDPQGVTHTEAVFETNNASLNSNCSENYTFNLAQDGMEESRSTDEYTNINISYSMYYWASQANKDAGALPYTLANAANGGSGFNVSDDFLKEVEYTSLPVALQAEKHCLEVILA